MRPTGCPKPCRAAGGASCRRGPQGFFQKKKRHRMKSGCWGREGNLSSFFCACLRGRTGIWPAARQPLLRFPGRKTSARPMPMPPRIFPGKHNACADGGQVPCCGAGGCCSFCFLYAKVGRNLCEICCNIFILLVFFEFLSREGIAFRFCFLCADLIVKREENSATQENKTIFLEQCMLHDNTCRPAHGLFSAVGTGLHVRTVVQTQECFFVYIR